MCVFEREREKESERERGRKRETDRDRTNCEDGDPSTSEFRSEIITCLVFLGTVEVLPRVHNLALERSGKKYKTVK